MERHLGDLSVATVVAEHLGWTELGSLLVACKNFPRRALKEKRDRAYALAIAPLFAARTGRFADLPYLRHAGTFLLARFRVSNPLPGTEAISRKEALTMLKDFPEAAAAFHAHGKYIRMWKRRRETCFERRSGLKHVNLASTCVSGTLMGFVIEVNVVCRTIRNEDGSWYSSTSSEDSS